MRLYNESTLSRNDQHLGSVSTAIFVFVCLLTARCAQNHTYTAMLYLLIVVKGVIVHSKTPF